MKIDVRIFAKKSIFSKYEHIGFLNLGWSDKLEFICPSKGDIITVTENLIRVWNSEYTNVPLKVQYVRYNYMRDENDEVILDIIVFVKK